MAKKKAEKRKVKRKVALKERRAKISLSLRKDKADYFFYEALRFDGKGEYDKALSFMEKALKLDPQNQDILHELGYLGFRMQRSDVELKGAWGLYQGGNLKPEGMPALCHLLAQDGRYAQALKVADETLALVPRIKLPQKRKLRKDVEGVREYCRVRLSTEGQRASAAGGQKTDLPFAPAAATAATLPPEPKAAAPVAQAPAAPPPTIPVAIQVDVASFEAGLTRGRFTTPQRYELALEGHRIRFQESFENLICLNQLREVRSFWYQEETARKVLKGFRGRALLADEVGLGKTIEALIVFKEYVQRGMVKSALILTPTPLVSQWRDELQTKFGFGFPCTDDPDYRTRGEDFWQAPFLLASINLAKSKKNFPLVTARDYDLVIVDEAHHLKNRNTLNWKLVNALKKRFLLLLTATPVENNLMELYSLVTLLKPGQLKTASAFRQEFMTRGDPTDPQNRSRLRELLGQVMIRNTRAVAKIDIPPRFAQTVRVEPSPAETTLYERICALIRALDAGDATGRKLLAKTLLAEAGSSPQAVGRTLARMLAARELPPEQADEIRAIHALCHTVGDTRKNRLLLKLIASSPGKIIIFVKYLGTLEHLSDFLTRRQIPHALFHGSLDNAQKDAQIEHFKGEVDLLVTTEIGGEGRNLQFCHQMVNYDLPWNPMKIEQRIGRIHRIGQTREVTIYNLCAAGSLEEYILEVLDKKINMFEMVIGEIDMILGRIKGEQEFADIVYDIWVDSISEAERRKSFERLAVQLKRTKASYQKTKTLDEKLFGENYEL